MSTLIPCPYLGGMVELTDEREQHIAETHPDLLPEHREPLIRALADPDRIALSSRSASTRLFGRWFPDIRQGKYVVVVVATDRDLGRHWILTAYLTRKLARGVIEWTRP